MSSKGKEPSPGRSPTKGKSKRKTHNRRFQSEPPPISAFFPSPISALFQSSPTGGLEEEAEGHLLKVLEERRARATSQEAGWDASVEGESPPLRRVSFQGAAMFTSAEEEEGQGDDDDRRRAARLRFKNLVTKVSSMHSKLPLNSSGQEPLSPVQEERDRPDVFHGVGGEDTRIGKSAFSQSDTNTDMVISAAMAVSDNYKQEDDTTSVASSSAYSDVGNEEMLPLVSEADDSEQRGGWFGYGSAERRDARRKRRRSARRKWRKRGKKCLRSIDRAFRCDRYWFSELCHPISFGKVLFKFITTSWFTKLGLPSLILAFILFYYLHNPTLDFIEQGTISWWLVFIARQSLTLQLAIITQSVIIDGLAMRSRFAVRIFSPLLTLCIISAKGWPFNAASKCFEL